MGAERLRTGTDGVTRCWWCGDDPLYVRYHDEEWGHEVVDDTRLFEKLCLEGFQSGLSWLTILRKRDNFRAAFDGFDPTAVAAYGPADVERLLAHPDYRAAAPTPDHFLPLAYVAGIAAARGATPEVLVGGCTMGSLSMTSYTVAP